MESVIQFSPFLVNTTGKNLQRRCWKKWTDIDQLSSSPLGFSGSVMPNELSFPRLQKNIDLGFPQTQPIGNFNKPSSPSQSASPSPSSASSSPSPSSSPPSSSSSSASLSSSSPSSPSTSPSASSSPSSLSSSPSPSSASASTSVSSSSSSSSPSSLSSSSPSSASASSSTSASSSSSSSSSSSPSSASASSSTSASSSSSSSWDLRYDSMTVCMISVYVFTCHKAMLFPCWMATNCTGLWPWGEVAPKGKKMEETWRERKRQRHSWKDMIHGLWINTWDI